MVKRFILVLAIAAGVCLGDSSPLVAQSKEQGIALYNKAVQLRTKGQSGADREKALKLYQEALKIFERGKSEGWIAVTLFNVGDVYKSLAQYQKALEFFTKAQQVSKKIGNAKDEGVALDQIGQVYYALHDYPKAGLQFYEQGLAITRKVRDIKQEGYGEKTQLRL